MKESTLQILLVEDNAGDARLLCEMFATANEKSFQLTHVLRMSDAEAYLAKGDVDIVLLDMGLPDAHGIETVRRTHAAAPGIPIIVLTGLEDEALAAEAMRAEHRNTSSRARSRRVHFHGLFVTRLSASACW